MSSHYAVINGNILRAEDAKIAINDLAIQRGYGIFDFFKTIDDQPVFLDDHIDRFYHSAEEMRLIVEWSRHQLKELIMQLMKKNNLAGSGIRITLTGGYSDDGYTLNKPNFLITQTPFRYDSTNFENGTRLVTYEHQRQLPAIKTIDYLKAIWLQPFIRENDADDVLYHYNQEIRECPRSNIFIVTPQNEIITPADQILKGIIRKKVLALPGFDIHETNIHHQQLNSAKEVFITSTTKNILPVLEINGKPVGDGRPGQVSRELIRKILEQQPTEQIRLKND